MALPLTIEQIAKATNSKTSDVCKVWPFLQSELAKRKVVAIQPIVAVLATAAVESHFRVVPENGGQAYFRKMYSKRADYVEGPDGLWTWRGRGIIQLTGKENYAKYGKKIGVDLIANPDAALVPENAAKILAAYMDDHGCFVWASRGHWWKVRRLVNGGYNGLDVFLTSVRNLLDVAHG